MAQLLIAPKTLVPSTADFFRRNVSSTNGAPPLAPKRTSTQGALSFVNPSIGCVPMTPSVPVSLSCKTCPILTTVRDISMLVTGLSVTEELGYLGTRALQY